MTVSSASAYLALDLSLKNFSCYWKYE